MAPVLIVSLFDPVLWASIWFFVWCAYRLPKWSWMRLPLAILGLGGMAGIVVFQAHLLGVIEPVGFDPKIIDRVFFPEIIPALVLMFYTASREDRAKKRREAAGSQPAVDAGCPRCQGK